MSAAHGRPRLDRLGQHDGGQDSRQLLLCGAADDGLLVHAVLRPEGGHQADEAGEDVGSDGAEQDELGLVVGQIELHLPLNGRNLTEGTVLSVLND